MVTFLVTGWLLDRCRPGDLSWPDYLDWVCRVLNVNGDMPTLDLLPALIQHG